MKAAGKLTKSEWLLLALAAAFLAALALLYADASRTAAGTDYTISTQRRSEEPVTPDPLQTPREPEAAGPVDINTADVLQLQTLPGIGPVLAERIVQYREEHGPFQSVEELLQVKGIGEVTLERFRSQAAVGEAGGEPDSEKTQEDTIP